MSREDELDLLENRLTRAYRRADDLILDGAEPAKEITLIFSAHTKALDILITACGPKLKTYFLHAILDWANGLLDRNINDVRHH